jgi:hypothetical protein
MHWALNFEGAKFLYDLPVRETVVSIPNVEAPSCYC